MTPQEFNSLQQENVIEFFKKHRTDDPKSVALKFSGKSDLPIRAITEQIHCYQKAKKKLPTLSKHALIYDSVAIEQCSSDATASYKSSLLKGNLLVDLTGGLGIDVVYFSQNFERIIHCERNEMLSSIAEYNFKQLGIKRIQTHVGDSIELLGDAEDGSIDWIYLDPARRDVNKRFASLEECAPNVVEIQELLLKKSKNICVKISPGADFTSVKRSIKCIKEFIVVSVNNECKEILLILERDYSDQIEVKSVMINSRNGKIEVIQKKEKSYYQKSQSSQIYQYFYEPDLAIIKARLSAKLAHTLGIAFINMNVDYMTSKKFVENFPGRHFEVLEVVPYGRKTLKTFFQINNITKANVARRDFPDSPEFIKKIFKLKDGGEDYLFFTTNYDGKFICIHCKRVRS